MTTLPSGLQGPTSGAHDHGDSDNIVIASAGGHDAALDGATASGTSNLDGSSVGAVGTQVNSKSIAADTSNATAASGPGTNSHPLLLLSLIANANNGGNAASAGLAADAAAESGAGAAPSSTAGPFASNPAGTLSVPSSAPGPLLAFEPSSVSMADPAALAAAVVSQQLGSVNAPALTNLYSSLLQQFNVMSGGRPGAAASSLLGAHPIHSPNVLDQSRSGSKSADAAKSLAKDDASKAAVSSNLDLYYQTLLSYDLLSQLSQHQQFILRQSQPDAKDSSEPQSAAAKPAAQLPQNAASLPPSSSAQQLSTTAGSKLPLAMDSIPNLQTLSQKYLQNLAGSNALQNASAVTLQHHQALQEALASAAAAAAQAQAAAQHMQAAGGTSAGASDAAAAATAAAVATSVAIAASAKDAKSAKSGEAGTSAEARGKGAADSSLDREEEAAVALLSCVHAQRNSYYAEPAAANGGGKRSEDSEARTGDGDGDQEPKPSSGERADDAEESRAPSTSSSITLELPTATSGGLLSAIPASALMNLTEEQQRRLLEVFRQKQSSIQQQQSGSSAHPASGAVLASSSDSPQSTPQSPQQAPSHSALLQQHLHAAKLHQQIQQQLQEAQAHASQGFNFGASLPLGSGHAGSGELSGDDQGPGELGEAPDMNQIMSIKRNAATGKFHCPFPICREAFARRYNLKTHFSARHAQIKSYICEECGRSFARRYDLNRHWKLVHLVNNPNGVTGSPGMSLITRGRTVDSPLGSGSDMTQVGLMSMVGLQIPGHLSHLSIPTNSHDPDSVHSGSGAIGLSGHSLHSPAFHDGRAHQSHNSLLNVAQHDSQATPATTSDLDDSPNASSHATTLQVPFSIHNYGAIGADEMSSPLPPAPASPSAAQESRQRPPTSPSSKRSLSDMKHEENEAMVKRKRDG